MMLLPCFALLCFFFILFNSPYRGVPFIYPSSVNQSIRKSPAFCSWSLGASFSSFLLIPPFFFYSFILS
ncbi:MAG: hypothetical protein JOS17DRAFT_739549 [Linnemannia elongata]|nr:MAG: hypothetical protein JOS17DRAFT_739549 [Linnemannia elongata]